MSNNREFFILYKLIKFFSEKCNDTLDRKRFCQKICWFYHRISVRIILTNRIFILNYHFLPLCKLSICFSFTLVKYIMFSNDFLYSSPLFLQNSRAVVYQILVCYFIAHEHLGGGGCHRSKNCQKTFASVDRGYWSE
jgi:hypothetical protein